MTAAGDRPEISVIVATAKRPGLLARALESLVACDFPGDRFEVVVVDNGGDPDTRDLCDSFRSRLALESLVATAGGKNAALNRGVETARGELFAFIDDDVIVDGAWLGELARAARRWTEHAVFGGRIVPSWPGERPGYVEGSRYMGVLFSVVDRGPREGPDPDFLPFGPNMAIRRHLFDRGLRYDPRIGPGTGRSYVMGSETELLRRLRRAGHIAVYVPACTVHHRIRREQLSVPGLLRRGVRYGKMLARESPATAPRWLGAPRWAYRELLENAGRCLGSVFSGRASATFDRAMDAAVAVGKIAYYRGDAGPQSGSVS